MTFQQFLDSLTAPKPAAEWSTELQALWYDKQENWNIAHDLVDQVDTPKASEIHAYLHRKEGDSWNANYWYRRVGQQYPKISLSAEWEQLVRKNLS